MSLARLLLLAPIVLISACVSPPARRPAPPAARPTPPPPPRPLPAPPAEAETALTPGSWAYRQDARGALALFGPGGVDALVVLRCDRAARRLLLSAPGAAPATLTLTTTSATKAFATTAAGSASGYVTAEIAVDDAILDAAAFSRGRFTITTNATSIVTPPWPEVARVIEDCRG